MNIAENLVVTINYQVKDTDGKVLESSDQNGPLTYLHGAHNLIPGLENALTGKTVGEALTVEVQPEQGYGPIMPELIQKVPHDAFQDIDQVELGMVFHAEGDNGQVHQVTVTEVESDGVTVDANHPLAGKTLTFDVSIEGVREATEEEVEHGHVHGPGGHEH